MSNNHNFNKRTDDLLRELRQIAADLPMVTRHRIINRCDKLATTLRRADRHGISVRPLMEEGQTDDQIAARYVARQAILEAMKKGRRVSFLDASDFRCSEMHTQICCIRQQIERQGLPYVLQSEWAALPNGGRYKEYWLEDAPEGAPLFPGGGAR